MRAAAEMLVSLLLTLLITFAYSLNIVTRTMPVRYMHFLFEYCTNIDKNHYCDIHEQMLWHNSDTRRGPVVAFSRNDR